MERLQLVLLSSFEQGGERPLLVGLLPLVSVLVMATYTLAAYAAEPTVAEQWNIMVVPGNQTAFSGRARELFNSHCASCHSKDGRAQTPVARQRHVQDLSECRLSDEGIVQQILQGTHDKKVDFKMPAFNVKLTRPEIDALVPLVKAFRPALLEYEDPAAVNPRLVGLINFPNHQAAILEKTASSGCYFLLNPNESHDGIQLTKILPEQGTVQVWVHGRNSIVALKLDGRLIQTRKARLPKFLRDLFRPGEGDQYGLALNKATTDLVLFLYSQFTGRTLLRSPRLPTLSFNLDVTTRTQSQIVRALESALASSGIAVVPDGDKFLLVVPTAEISLAKPCGAQIKTSASFDKQRTLFPGGVFINLPNAELNQAASLYTGLTGRMFCSAEGLPSNRVITLTTQTALSLEECAYALETLFNWHGLDIVPLDDGDFDFKQVAGAKP